MILLSRDIVSATRLIDELYLPEGRLWQESARYRNQLREVASVSTPPRTGAASMIHLDDPESEVQRQLFFPHGDEDSTRIVPSSHQDGSRFIRRALVVLCGIGVGLSYCDRVNLSVAVVSMATEFDWDISEKGFVLGGFFYGYLLSQVFGALLSKRYGGELVFGIAAFCWSLTTLLVPLCASLGTTALWLNRIVLGILEGVTFPVVYHLFALNIPKAERSRSVSVISVSVSFGAVFAFYYSPIIIHHHSWQRVFYFFGMLGLGWVCAWGLFWRYNHNRGFPIYVNGKLQRSRFRLKTKEPLRRVVRVNNLSTVNAYQVDETKLSSSFWYMCTVICKLLRYPVVLAIMWCHFCHNIGHYVVLSWLPTLLDSELGVHGEQLSITSVPYIVMGGLAVVFGAVADRMIASKVPTSREAGVATICITFFMNANGDHNETTVAPSAASEIDFRVVVTISLLALSLGLNASAPVAGYESAKLDIIDQSKVGLLQGLSNSFASLAGVIGVPFVSAIFSLYGSWKPVFYWIAFMFWSASFVFYVYGRWEQKIVL